MNNTHIKKALVPIFLGVITTTSLYAEGKGDDLGLVKASKKTTSSEKPVSLTKPSAPAKPAAALVGDAGIKPFGGQKPSTRKPTSIRKPSSLAKPFSRKKPSRSGSSQTTSSRTGSPFRSLYNFRSGSSFGSHSGFRSPFPFRASSLFRSLFPFRSMFAFHRYRPPSRRSPFPPPWDPSAYGPLDFSDLPDDLEPANQGAFEGGETESVEDTTRDNSIPEDEQQDNGRFNGPPSPLYSAEAFSQKMLRFEEFGGDRLRLRGRRQRGWSPLPAPQDAQSGPDSAELENFLSQQIWPKPRKFSNTTMRNPWEREIEDYLGRNLRRPPAEGRPPGEGWSHQRWEEFTPKVYFQTATNGARTNGGFRDEKQRHGYTYGEFCPTGLYYNTGGAPGLEGTTNGIAPKFHPNMPLQEPNTLWTFDGTFPPKLLQSRYGEPVLMRHYNTLPVDVSANRGFGLHTITTHEHNGHNPAESDGYANAFFFPGQFYDYRWPMVLAGHDSINTRAQDRRSGMPDGRGGIINIPGDFVRP